MFLKIMRKFHFWGLGVIIQYCGKNYIAKPRLLEFVVCWNYAKGFLSDLKNWYHKKEYRTITQALNVLLQQDDNIFNRIWKSNFEI